MSMEITKEKVIDVVKNKDTPVCIHQIAKDISKNPFYNPQVRHTSEISEDIRIIMSRKSNSLTVVRKDDCEYSNKKHGFYKYTSGKGDYYIPYERKVKSRDKREELKKDMVKKQSKNINYADFLDFLKDKFSNNDLFCIHRVCKEFYGSPNLEDNDGDYTNFYKRLNRGIRNNDIIEIEKQGCDNNYRSHKFFRLAKSIANEQDNKMDKHQSSEENTGEDEVLSLAKKILSSNLSRGTKYFFMRELFN